MKNNTIEFSTGDLKLDDNSLSFYKKNVRLNNVSTILREDIGHVITEPIKLLPNAQMIHWFQLITFGFTFSLIGFVIEISTDTYLMLSLGIGLVFLCGFLLFSNLWLDSVLGIKIATPIVYALFGVNYYRVVVQNIFGGNNLIFLIKKDEISRMPNIENYKISKKHNAQPPISRPRIRSNVFL